MYIFLIDKDRKSLYPTQRIDLVKKWLRKGQARYLHSRKVVQVFKKFTNKPIKHIKYSIGIDPGYITIGYAITKINSNTGLITVLVSGEFTLNTPKIKEELETRKMWRKARRRHRRQRAKRRHKRNNSGVKFRHPRWKNRKNKQKLNPSTRYLIDCHVNAIEKLYNRCRFDDLHIEYNKFDLHKLANPLLAKWQYQFGAQVGFTNTKQYVLYRDEYVCQRCKATSDISKKGKKDKRDNKPYKYKTTVNFEVHHIVPKSSGGSDHHTNLVTLCQSCHSTIHKQSNLPHFNVSNKIVLKAASLMNTAMKYIVQRLKNDYTNVIITYGSVTKTLRQLGNMTKTHANDAIVISISNANGISYSNTEFKINNYTTSYVKYKRHSRARVYAHKERQYVIDFDESYKVHNRRKASEQKLPSLECYLKEYTYRHIEVKPAKRSYSKIPQKLYPGYKLLFPGNNNYVTMTGHSTTQKMVTCNKIKYSISDIKSTLKLSGFVT